MKFQLKDLENFALDVDVPIVNDYPHSCKHMIDEINLHELELNEMQLEIIHKLLGQGVNRGIKLFDLSKISSKHFSKYSPSLYSNQFLLWTKLRSLLLDHAHDCPADESGDIYIKSNYKKIIIQSVPISEMKLSVRSKNILQRQGYKYSDDLINLTLEKLLSFRNLGHESAMNISKELQRLNIWQIETENEVHRMNPPDARNFPTGIYHLNYDIEVIGFSTRTYNCLKRAGVNIIKDLISMSEFEIRDLRNLGEKSYQEIMTATKDISSKIRQSSNGYNSDEKDSVIVEEIVSGANRKIFHDIGLIEKNYSFALHLHVSEYGMWKSDLSPYFNDFLILNVQTVGEMLNFLKLQLKTPSTTYDYLMKYFDAIKFISYLSNYLLSFSKNIGKRNMKETILKLKDPHQSLFPNLIEFDEVTSYLFSSDAVAMAEKLECVNFQNFEELNSSCLVFDREFLELSRNLNEFCSTYKTLPNFLGLVIALGSNGKDSKVGKLLIDFLAYSRPESYERDFDIILRRLSGETLDAISTPFGLTRERIRQILNKLNPNLPSLIESLIVENRNLFAENMQSKIKSTIDKYGAIYIGELETELGIPFDKLRGFIPLWYKKFIFEHSQKIDKTKKWDRSEVVNAIKKASTYYFPLTGPHYQYLLEIGEIEGPSLQRIYQVFGTWSEMCIEAGVEFKRAFRTSDYYRKWNDMELLSFVVRFLKDKNLSDSYEEFRTWRDNQNDDVPSPELIRNTLGTWLEIKSLALQTIRQETPRKESDEF